MANSLTENKINHCIWFMEKEPITSSWFQIFFTVKQGYQVNEKEALEELPYNFQTIVSKLYVRWFIIIFNARQ